MLLFKKCRFDVVCKIVELRFSFLGPRHFLMWICEKSLFCWKTKESKCSFSILLWCNLCCKSAHFMNFGGSVHFLNWWCVKIVVSRRVCKIVDLRFGFFWPRQFFSFLNTVVFVFLCVLFFFRGWFSKSPENSQLSKGLWSKSLRDVS